MHILLQTDFSFTEYSLADNGLIVLGSLLQTASLKEEIKVLVRQGWKDDSAVENTGCSSRGLSSQPPVTLAPENSLLASAGTAFTHAHTQKKGSQINT